MRTLTPKEKNCLAEIRHGSIPDDNQSKSFSRGGIQQTLHGSGARDFDANPKQTRDEYLWIRGSAITGRVVFCFQHYGRNSVDQLALG